MIDDRRLISPEIPFIRWTKRCTVNNKEREIRTIKIYPITDFYIMLQIKLERTWWKNEVDKILKTSKDIIHEEEAHEHL
jgi:hypothetical protein